MDKITKPRKGDLRCKMHGKSAVVSGETALLMFTVPKRNKMSIAFNKSPCKASGQGLEKIEPHKFPIV